MIRKDKQITYHSQLFEGLGNVVTSECPRDIRSLPFRVTGVTRFLLLTSNTAYELLYVGHSPSRWGERERTEKGGLTGLTP